MILFARGAWFAGLQYDGAQDFNDFSPFGGWTTPNIKQYAGDATGPYKFAVARLCGAAQPPPLTRRVSAGCAFCPSSFFFLSFSCVRAQFAVLMLTSTGILSRPARWLPPALSGDARVASHRGHPSERLGWQMGIESLPSAVIAAASARRAARHWRHAVAARQRCTVHTLTRHACTLNSVYPLPLALHGAAQPRAAQRHAQRHAVRPTL